MKPYCTIVVSGIPRPGGSKRAFPFIKFIESLPGSAEVASRSAFSTYLRKFVKLGVTVADDAKYTKAWQKAVVNAARALRLPVPEKGCEYAVWYKFFMPRPNYHHVASDPTRPLKPGMPKRCRILPDGLKLTRAVEDALTGIVWWDDAEVSAQHIVKLYGLRPGVVVTVYRLAEAPVPKEPKKRKVLDMALFKKAGVI